MGISHCLCELRHLCKMNLIFASFPANDVHFKRGFEGQTWFCRPHVIILRERAQLEREVNHKSDVKELSIPRSRRNILVLDNTHRSSIVDISVDEIQTLSEIGQDWHLVREQQGSPLVTLIFHVWYGAPSTGDYS